MLKSFAIGTLQGKRVINQATKTPDNCAEQTGDFSILAFLLLFVCFMSTLL